MSWFSNLAHALLGAVEGSSGSSTPIVSEPKTAVENAVNTDAAAVVNIASTTAAAVKTEAVSTVNNYLDTSIGAVPTQIADAALQGLATVALTKMSTSSNKTEAEIADALSGFLKSL